MLHFPTLIYDTLEKENEQSKPRGHYPSSASFLLSTGELLGSDLLSQYLKWKEVPYSNPNTGSDLFKMRLGDGAHYSVSNALKRTGLKVLSEIGASVKVEGLKNTVNYRVDNLVEDEGKLVVLEIKSTMQQVMYSPGWGIKFTGPKLDHLLQLICYLELVPTVSYGALIYVDRGSGGMLQFNVTKKGGYYYIDGKKVPEFTWEGIVDRWKQLEGYLERNEAPEPEYFPWINEKTGEIMDVKTIDGKRFKTDWQVIYSPYRNFLWKNPDNFKYTYNAKYGNPV